VGWKYEDLEKTGINPGGLMCKCGHLGEYHHVVYWQLGMTIDECEAYGSNETGGMKGTLTGWFFYRIVPPKPMVYDRDENGKVIYPGHRRPQPVREFLRRVPGLRGPWFKDHCHHFEEE